MRKEFSRDPSLSFTTKTHETICARYGVQPSGCTPGQAKGLNSKQEARRITKSFRSVEKFCGEGGVTAIHYPRVASLKTVEAFRKHLESIGAEIPIDDQLDAPALSP